MRTHTARPSWGASQHVTERVIGTLERFLHIEAVSGGVLIAAAFLALWWANSSLADSYHALWHSSVTVAINGASATQSLHFLVNDGLMTIFFLVAGLEIRREMHEGALTDLKMATLPLVAAFGGVIAPALIYLSFNLHTDAVRGWAVPIATDIAFALGVLALLGRAIPRGVRVLLLALAIIDDVVAVLVIALFYSETLKPDGVAIAVSALACVFLFQRLGIRAAMAYVLPGIVLWGGLWRLGVHPTLAGVILGLITPVVPLTNRSRSLTFFSKLEAATQHAQAGNIKDDELISSLKQVQLAQRDLIPPAIGVQTVLHPWVAYGIMPLFAFANAGVSLTGTTAVASGSGTVLYGIAVALLIGKPLGILLASGLVIRLGWCGLPTDVGWKGLLLVALLGGIGFTMSIFIATLAFGDSDTLAVAKFAILLASFAAALLAFGLGKVMFTNRTELTPPSGAAVGTREK